MGKGQRGIAVEGMVMIIAVTAIVAAFLGLWAYYSTVNTALAESVKAKDIVITTLTKEKAECAGEVAGLKLTNSGFLTLTEKQNTQLEAVVREREEANAKWKQAERDASQKSLAHKKTITEILGTNLKRDDNWCLVWGGMVDDYVQKRQGAK